jgi:hypothetical protein
MSCYQPATATQLNREADHEGYCLVADWLNSARLLNWVRDLQICINCFGISVVSKYAMALLAQAVNPESNLMAGLEIDGGPLAHADSGRGFRGNDVSGMKTYEPAHITHQVRDTEHHHGGLGVLIAVAINLEAEMQILLRNETNPASDTRANDNCRCEMRLE